MTNEKKPFFSVVIPLYNKQSHVKETLETVFAQTFQDFEIVIVNDGSTDNSAKIVESIDDKRIRVIHQDNAGVSVARNRGIKEAKADYIAFLDADDIWLPEFLETIYELIEKFPDAGLYATQYEKMDAQGNKTPINLKGLPSKEYIGILPNYFKSHALGDNPTWTSALCIPRKIFLENDIWFPVGEKYGEDIHVWSRIAISFNIAFNTKVCALYMIEAENNTKNSSLKETEPYKCILMLKDFRKNIEDAAKLKYFDKLIERHIVTFVWFNMQQGNAIRGYRLAFENKISFKYLIASIILSLVPRFLYPTLRKIKKKFR